MMALYVQNDQNFLMVVILLALIVQKILSACLYNISTAFLYSNALA